MLSWAAPVQIYLARGTTDLRRSVDGLAGLVRNAMERDPFSGHLFVFCNRRRDRVKILVFESSGFWVLYKRLEKGTFAWPDGEGGSVSMTGPELTLLLSGIDLRGARRRRWYRRAA